MATKFRIYEGFSFKLTDEQVAGIGEAINELGENDDKPEAEQSAMLAQVWVADEGVFCCCHVVPGGKAKIIRDVIRTGSLLATKVETR